MNRALAALCFGLTLILIRAAPAQGAAEDGPVRAAAFLDRVFKALPATLTESYTFKAWAVGDNPTKEGFGLLRTDSPVDPETLVRLVMDVDHYKPNLDHVEECRAIPDVRFKPPSSVRFYQRVNIPLVDEIQHELVLNDGGTRNGYRVLYWYNLATETAALDRAKGARSAYSVGLWLISKDAVGYGVSNAPYREDVSAFDWTALTTGADAAASPVVKANIQGLIDWSRR